MSVKLFSSLALCIVLNVACGDESYKASETSAGSSALPACQLSKACSQELPSLPRPKGFSSIYKKLITKLGKPLHRGHDVIALAGAPIWILAKFTYGIFDADLHEEPIDIYLSQDCKQGLKKIGQGFTTLDDEHFPVDGVDDTGGRIFVNLATLGIKNLPVGRHRIVLVVPGDNSMTELYITIVEPNQKIVVSDIDGTLAQGELAAVADALGKNPAANAGSAAALQLLVEKGFHILYLTARPEWLMADTRSWLKSHGYPLGSLRTTTSKIGATGAAAVKFKMQELNLLRDQTGIVPTLALGNRDSDVEAFSEAGIPAKGSYYYGLETDLAGGNEFSNYSILAESFQSLTKVCQ